jgi:hypothetical protein
MRAYDNLLKYPRTQHLQGSRLQLGDDDTGNVAFSSIANKTIVVEEKVDGQNAGISFDDDGALLLQSRGHYLRGGPREASFAPFKSWAHQHRGELHDALGGSYILFGEWCYAKHTVFYDSLPHYFLAFDLYDKKSNLFVDTALRRAVLKDTSVVEVPVLAMRAFATLGELLALAGPSTCKTAGWTTALREACVGVPHLDVERTVRDTDPHDDMEGLYLKIEEQGAVVERLKWVRASFLQTVVASDSHWFDRPIVPNQLKSGASLFNSTP